MQLQASWIVFENDQFIAINKPSGMLTIPDREQSEPSLKDLLIQKFGSIFTVHRLDKDTSGLVVFAKNEGAHKFLSALFEGRQIEKYYLGLVQGSPTPAVGSIDAPIQEHAYIKGKMMIHRNGKASLTDYEVLEDVSRIALVKFNIHTGRTHQIRVHAANIGHPILCDSLYGDGQPILLSKFKKNYKLSKHEEEERPILKRLALHSSRLLFTDEQGNRHELEAPLPKDMRALLQQLKKS
ncbi:MAG: hypothetical protein RLY16_71 [Bacteroidota bacterium]|jgi:23S rRNA pseudouridine955/2504/2580 synthase/23S rRNA pseudouridine1911/1915/1917 synthase